MTIPGNPKQFARDIADGFFVFNQSTCRQFTPAELRRIYRLLELVAREIRAEQIPSRRSSRSRRRTCGSRARTTRCMFIRNHAKRYGVVL